MEFEWPVDSETLNLMAIAPDPIVYDYVGELYRAILEGLTCLDREYRNASRSLFIGLREVQDSGDWTANLKIFPITDLQSTTRTSEFIIVQGKGTPEGRESSHYQRFKDILVASRREKETDSGFDLSRPVAWAPLTRQHRGLTSEYTL